MKYINGKYYTDAEIEALIEKNRDSSIEDVQVELIGKAKKGTQSGAILSGIDGSSENV